MADAQGALLSPGVTPSTPTAQTAPERRWLTPRQGAARANCGVKLIYNEVRAGRLRAARIGGRRELRMLPEWIDDWLKASSEPVEISRGFRVAR
jgi:hypothetical protein